MCSSRRCISLLLRVDSGVPALPQHHGPAGLPRLPQYDAVHAHEHAEQPRGHVVQSAVTRMHPESEEEESRHAEVLHHTAYLGFATASHGRARQPSSRQAHSAGLDRGVVGLCMYVCRSAAFLVTAADYLKLASLRDRLKRVRRRHWLGLAHRTLIFLLAGHLCGRRLSWAFVSQPNI